MALLTFGWGGVSGGCGGGWATGFEAGGDGSTGAEVIADEGGADLGGVLVEDVGEVTMEEFNEAMEGEAMGPAGLDVEPVREGEEGGEGRGMGPEPRGGFGEVPAVGDAIPGGGEPAEALQCGEIEETVGEDFAGWNG